MYHSPVPLIVIRPGAHSLIEVNGQLLGECLPDSHLAMPASGDGDYFITATPLSPQAQAWPITRKLTLREGSAQAPQAGDLSLYAWPGGVCEVLLPSPDKPQPGRAGFPRELDQLSYCAGSHRRDLTLYYEETIKLLSEEAGHPPVCLNLGKGEHGSLALYTGSGRQFLAVSIFCSGRQRLLMLNPELEAALELSAREIFLEQDGVVALDDIGTAMGHQRRTLYRCTGGAFVAEQPDTGFFTRKYVFPDNNRLLGMAFLEAVREGFEQEALSYLTPELRSSGFNQIREFLGDYQDVRPPLSDDEGRLAGLIQVGQDRIYQARLVEFSFNGGLIDDISQV